MRIGLVRAMEYYRNRIIWTAFFKTLGFEVVISPETNKEILQNGIKYAIDESCLPSKLFLGHVHWLKDRCDYILIPRIENLGKNDHVCVKFNAMYDIVRNTFDVKVLDYNIDLSKRMDLKRGLISVATRLGISASRANKAFCYAMRLHNGAMDAENKRTDSILNERGFRLLIVSHSYNAYDKMIGQPITKKLSAFGAKLIYADGFNKAACLNSYGNITQSLYWTYNKELVGAIELCKNKIDGIVFITAFPCGPDSLVNELVLRRVKGIPALNIIVDEQQNDAGLMTRLESFMDILQSRRLKEVL